MTDIQERAFKAGYDGVLLSQLLVGIPEKFKKEATVWFLKGVQAKNMEAKK